MINNEILVIKRWLAFFMIMMFLSGLTAIPADAELSALLCICPQHSALYHWLDKVLTAYRRVNQLYAFLFYGYDWLAFAHFMLAILFIGPYKNPVKNRWVIEFGMLACTLILPFALLAGHFRHIPFGWQLVDCSFGIFGFLPLKICNNKIKSLSNKFTNQLAL